MIEDDIKKLVGAIHKSNDMQVTILAILQAFDLGKKKQLNELKEWAKKWKEDGIMISPANLLKKLDSLGGEG